MQLIACVLNYSGSSNSSYAHNAEWHLNACTRVRVSATRRLRSAAPAVGRRVLSGVHGRVFALIDAAAISIIIVAVTLLLG